VNIRIADRTTETGAPRTTHLWLGNGLLAPALHGMCGEMPAVERSCYESRNHSWMRVICGVQEILMKKLLLIGTIMLLMATSALAQSSGPTSSFIGGARGGGGFVTPPPDPRRVACLRANGVSPVQQNQHVIAMAIRRCLRSGHR